MTRNFEKKFPQKHITKMNTKTVRELRSITKDKGLRGFHKLKKDDLVALLLEQSAEEMSTPAPRSREKKRRSVTLVRIIASPQELKMPPAKLFQEQKVVY